MLHSGTNGTSRQRAKLLTVPAALVSSGAGIGEKGPLLSLLVRYPSSSSTCKRAPTSLGNYMHVPAAHGSITSTNPTAMPSAMACSGKESERFQLQVIQKSKGVEFLKSDIFLSEKAACNNKMRKRRSKYIHRKITYLH